MGTKDMRWGWGGNRYLVRAIWRQDLIKSGWGETEYNVYLSCGDNRGERDTKGIPGIKDLPYQK